MPVLPEALAEQSVSDILSHMSCCGECHVLIGPRQISSHCIAACHRTQAVGCAHFQMIVVCRMHKDC